MQPVALPKNNIAGPRSEFIVIRLTRHILPPFPTSANKYGVSTPLAPLRLPPGQEHAVNSKTLRSLSANMTGQRFYRSCSHLAPWSHSDLGPPTHRHPKRLHPTAPHSYPRTPQPTWLPSLPVTPRLAPGQKPEPAWSLLAAELRGESILSEITLELASW